MSDTELKTLLCDELKCSEAFLQRTQEKGFSSTLALMDELFDPELFGYEWDMADLLSLFHDENDFMDPFTGEHEFKNEVITLFHFTSKMQKIWNNQNSPDSFNYLDHFHKGTFFPSMRRMRHELNIAFRHGLIMFIKDLSCFPKEDDELSEDIQAITQKMDQMSLADTEPEAPPSGPKDPVFDSIETPECKPVVSSPSEASKTSPEAKDMDSPDPPDLVCSEEFPDSSRLCCTSIAGTKESKSALNGIVDPIHVSDDAFAAKDKISSSMAAPDPFSHLKVAPNILNSTSLESCVPITSDLNNCTQRLMTKTCSNPVVIKGEVGKSPAQTGPPWSRDTPPKKQFQQKNSALKFKIKAEPKKMSESEDDPVGTTNSIQAAFDFLHNGDFALAHDINPKRLIVGGWSYGGGMGLIYAANHPEITHVFSIAGTDHGEFAREYQRNKTFAQTMDTMFQGLVYPAGPVKFAFTSIREDLLTNPAPYDFLLHCSKLAARKILLIGGLDDANVVVENHLIPGYRALKILGCESIQMNIFQDDHAFTNSRTEVAAKISAWITTALK